MFRKKPETWEWIVCAGITVLVGGLLWPVTACACGTREGARKSVCMSDLKQMSRALLLYADDSNGKLPPSFIWTQVLKDYAKNEKIFEHPNSKDGPKTGFAFNSLLSEKKSANDKHPEKTVLVYDSVKLGRNASDPVTSLPISGAHQGRNNFGYLDGHVKSMSVQGK